MIVTQLDEEERRKFEEIMEPLYEEFAPVIGEDLLERLLEASGH